MDFWNGRDFSDWNNTSSQNEHNSSNTNADTGYDANINEGFEDKFNEYSGKSEDELTGELLKSVNKLKGEGRFDVGELEDFFARSSNFLNDQQRARMRSIIDMLK